MRDPKRLKSCYEKLAALHAEVPDQRMGQFLTNLISAFPNDPFYMEEPEFLDIARQVVDSWKPKEV